jgi:hypothetical protein
MDLLESIGALVFPNTFSNFLLSLPGIIGATICHKI